MEAFEAFLKWGGWTAVLGFLGLAATIGVGIVAFRYPSWERQFEAEVRHPESRLNLLRGLTANRSSLSRYLGGIEGLNGWLRRVFGEPMSWRAFDKCLVIAFIYPLALILIAWVFGGKASIGPFELTAEASFGERIAAVVTLFAASISLGVYFRYDVPPKAQNWVEQVVEKTLLGASLIEQRNARLSSKFVGF